MVALIYPFRWQHTYIPVLPPAMIDIVCSPTPFLVGLLASSLPLLHELPLEEVRWLLSWGRRRRGEDMGQRTPRLGLCGPAWSGLSWPFGDCSTVVPSE